MIEHVVVDELKAIEFDPDFSSRSAELVDVWISDGVGADSIESVLLFMEEHPDIDFGAPGALVHFVERFYRKGYEEKLVASVCRKPAVVTVWMVNRLLNGTKGEEERAMLMRTLESVLRNPLANPDSVEMAIRFLKRGA